MADDILGRIAAAKRAELRERYDGVSLDALRARATPTERSLVGALGAARRALHPGDQEGVALGGPDPARRRCRRRWRAAMPALPMR